MPAKFEVCSLTVLEKLVQNAQKFTGSYMTLVTPTFQTILKALRQNCPWKHPCQIWNP